MSRTCLVAVLLLVTGGLLAQPGFRARQQRYPRVREAYASKGATVNAVLREAGIGAGEAELYLQAFKHEKVLELWGRKRGTGPFLLLRSWKICASSGDAGPKRRQGDGQVPEGFYHIGIFNPASQFHLSLGLNYPNASDRILSDHRQPGGDIYIHGSCVTIGCIPIRDEGIRELYVFAVEARDGGQSNIPVTIYPARMEGSNLERLERLGRENEDCRLLWNELEQAYRCFKENRVWPDITFLPDGRHRVQ